MSLGYRISQVPPTKPLLSPVVALKNQDVYPPT